MPEAIAAAIIYFIPATAAIVFGTVTVASVLAYGIIIAGSYELSQLLQPKANNAASSAVAAQIPIRQPTPPRLRSYGRVKVAGAVAFEEVDNTKALWVQQLIGQGEIDAVEEFWLGDDQVVCTGNLGTGIGTPNGGVVNGHYPDNTLTTYIYGDGRAVILALLGTADQLAQTALSTAFPGDFTADFRWRGVPNVTLLFETPLSPTDAQKKFSYGPPNLRTVQRAAKVYDPRFGAQVADGDPDRPSNNNWIWSQNAAVVILDFLRHPDGWSRQVTGAGARHMVPIAQFNIASWIAFAYLCDEQVARRGTTLTVCRYFISGTYDMTAAPKTVLEGMLAACDGEIYRDGQGLIAIRGGAGGPDPTVVIGDNDIIEHSLKPGADKFSACNRIHAKFATARNDYQQVDMDPWFDQANIDLRGEELITTLDLTWTPNHSQARRIAKINIAKLNPSWSGTIVTGPRGLLAYGERFITLQIPELGINGPFLLTAFKPSPTLERHQLTVCAFDSSCYNWNAELEEGTAPALGSVAGSTPGAGISYVPIPFSLAVSITLDPLYGVYRAILTWTNPTFITLFNEAQYSVAGTAQLFDMYIADGVTVAKSDPATPLNPAGAYDFQVRCITPAGKASYWEGVAYP